MIKKLFDACINRHESGKKVVDNYANGTQYGCFYGIYRSIRIFFYFMLIL